MDDQLDLTFENRGQLFAHGLDDWRTERRKNLEELARVQGLPIGRTARIYFHNGPPCEGILLIDDDNLFVPDKRKHDLQLCIGRIRFTASDVASCVAVEE
jgi:hypothetical protein